VVGHSAGADVALQLAYTRPGLVGSLVLLEPALPRAEDEPASAAMPQAMAAARRPSQVLIGDTNYYGLDFEAAIAEEGIRLLRPARKGEPPRAGAQYFKPLRQVIESVNDTFKGQLHLERHGGHTLVLV
jgi:pimeloyl-ACP methyl ester carboxylesterase